MTVTDVTMLDLYRDMYTIRTFEERTSKLYREGVVPGFVHLSIGQEAVAVGVCSALRVSDGIVSNHRGHGHCLAKGAAPSAMFAELMGRVSGTSAGMGGSMHIADFAQGVFGANGIVAAGLPIAAGVAYGLRRRGDGDVVTVFFGDGAVAQGAFHEALNLSALWHLPVLFVCENNHFAEFSSTETQHPVPIVDRALGYGIEGFTVDGNDVLAVRARTDGLVRRLRRGEGPFLLECVTYRWHGHYEGDPIRYRDEDEFAAWRELDPLVLLAQRIDSAEGAPAREAIESMVRSTIGDAEKEALASDYPKAHDMYAFVESPRAVEVEGPIDAAGEAGYRVMDSVRDALRHSLATDAGVFVAGIDVGAGGNIFGLTRGLADEFPGRVLDTPISESALIGLAVGSAMTGLRPIVEIMYLDFIGVCFDQIMNQAAKIRFMSGGKAPMSLVIRTQFGSGRSSAAQHSQSLEALLAHIPGLTVVMPSTPADTYGLLRAAVLDPNPVVFIEHRLLYGKKGVRPPVDHVVPIGKGAIRRAGTDVTLVSWSRMVDYCLAAAERAADDGVSVEVIDLRTVAPFDEAMVLKSVEKTTRLVIAHEATKSGGVGAEIAARVSEKAVWRLDAPIIRVAPHFVPAPYSPPLEELWSVGIDDIMSAIRTVMAE